MAAGGAVIDSSVVVSTFGAQVRFSRSSRAAFTSDRPSGRRHPLPPAPSAGMPLWSRSDGDGPAVDDDARPPPAPGVIGLEAAVRTGNAQHDTR